MLVSFLDFDGVLNSDEYFISNEFKEYQKTFGLWVDHHYHLDKKAVKLYSEFVEKTNAKTIISSNWRFHHDTKELISILEKVGFVGEVIGTTVFKYQDLNLELLKSHKLEGTLRWYSGIYPVFIRGHLIFQKMMELNLTSDQIIIFDDRTDMDPLYDRLIQTDEGEGLTEENIEQALRLVK